MINFALVALAATALLTTAVATPTLAKSKTKSQPTQARQGIVADTTGRGCGYRMVPGFAGGWIKVRNTNCRF
jgi:hypothetical protein